MKKTFLILFPSLLLFLLLSPGHIASADRCTDQPPTGYGGTCYTVSCEITTQGAPLDESNFLLVAPCLGEFLQKQRETNPGFDCSSFEEDSRACGPTWISKCCKISADNDTDADTNTDTNTSTTCDSPNKCDMVTNCPGQGNSVSGPTCPKASDGSLQVCCKPKCPDCKPTGQCKNEDTSGKYQSCGATKDCCAAGSNDVKDPYGGVKPGGAPAGSVTIGPKDLSPVGTPSIPELIGIIVKGALGIVGSVSLLLFVYGGFIMLISQGDSGKIDKGKKIMIWTSIGLMIIFGSYIFVSYIVTNLGQGGKDSDGGDGGGGGETEKQVCASGYSCFTPGIDYICDTATPTGACSETKECCKPRQ